MKTLLTQTRRNITVFFKDKGMFFTSLLTPLILLLLYAAFLVRIYKDSFYSSFPDGFTVDSNILDGLVGGQLISSLLAVTCITVSFCSNMLMVQDKLTGAYKDFLISPVKSAVLSLSYYLSTLINTLIVSFFALGCGLIYLYCTGWFLSFTDVLLIMADILLLASFGTALSSIVNSFLTSQGQITAVGTIVSACYGFICGAYMPISSFGKSLRNALAFLPGTYGTSLIKTHCMQGAFSELAESGTPAEVIVSMKKGVDCIIYFFDTEITTPTKYLVIILSVVVLIGVYVLMNVLKNKKR